MSFKVLGSSFLGFPQQTLFFRKVIILILVMSSFMGRINILLDDSLHRALKRCALMGNVSLKQFVIDSVEARVQDCLGHRKG